MVEILLLYLLKSHGSWLTVTFSSNAWSRKEGTVHDDGLRTAGETWFSQKFDRFYFHNVIKFSVFLVYILKETHSHAINGFSVFVKGILKLLEIYRSLEAYN